jgi:hypothetical protein
MMDRSQIVQDIQSLISYGYIRSTIQQSFDNLEIEKCKTRMILGLNAIE